MIRLVALTGKKGSGKSLAAAALVEDGWVVEKFASPLKDMLRAYLGSAGLMNDMVERMIEGDLKEEPTRHLGGRTPRHAMQTLGTEWGREMIDPELWTNHWVRRVERRLALGFNVLVDDLRFPNEHDAFDHVAKGYRENVVEIIRPGLVSNDTHASEAYRVPAYVTLTNDRGPDDLQAMVRTLIETSSVPHHG